MASHWEKLDLGTIVVSEEPLDFWKNACKYFKWCDDNPIMNKKTLVSGKEAGRVVTEENIRPYTIKGLCLHCGVEEEWLRDIRASKDTSSMWFKTVSKVLYVIYIQSLENATVGVFNPIFVSKVLGFEKEETPTSGVKVEVIHSGIPELSQSENEVLEKLEKEFELSQNTKDKND